MSSTVLVIVDPGCDVLPVVACCVSSIATAVSNGGQFPSYSHGAHRHTFVHAKMMGEVDFGSILIRF